jgi:hypothetical protein
VRKQYVESPNVDLQNAFKTKRRHEPSVDNNKTPTTTKHRTIFLANFDIHAMQLTNRHFAVYGIFRQFTTTVARWPNFRPNNSKKAPKIYILCRTKVEAGKLQNLAEKRPENIFAATVYYQRFLTGNERKKFSFVFNV